MNKPNSHSGVSSCGSHIPVHKSVLSVFPVTGVLELGAGLHSTPLFFKHVDYVVSVESNRAWIDSLLRGGSVTQTKHKRIVHHKIPSTVIQTTPRDLIPPALLKSAIKFYSSFISPSLNYLFIDQYLGFRLESLMSLYNKFDVISYHDAQREQDHRYQYSLFRPTNQYSSYIYDTLPSHTGLLIKRELEHLIPRFKKSLEEESLNYVGNQRASYPFSFRKLSVS